MASTNVNVESKADGEPSPGIKRVVTGKHFGIELAEEGRLTQR